MDFCFMGDEDMPGKTIPVLVAKVKGSKMKMSSVVPAKSSGRFISRRVLEFLRETGHEQGDIVLKSDQEAAMKVIINEVGRVRAAAGGGRCIVEHSPVGSSASNGSVERAILSVEQQSRVLRNALEVRWGVKIPTNHPVIPWLVEYASVLLNRFEVSRDGKTAYERNKHKTAKVLGIEFGEAVLWRRKPVGNALAKFTCLWSDGIYLGICGKSNELIIGDKAGIWRTRSIQRRPLSERWSSGSAVAFTGVPWRTSDDDMDADGEKMEAEEMEGLQIIRDEDKKNEDEKVENPPPIRVHIRKEDLTKHGYSKRCPGCAAVLSGSTRQAHSEACRKRLESEMKGETKVKEAKQKMDEYYATILEKEDDNRKRKHKEEDGGAEKKDMDTEKKEEIVVKEKVDIDENMDNKASGSGMKRARQAGEVDEEEMRDDDLDGEAEHERWARRVGLRGPVVINGLEVDQVPDEVDEYDYGKEYLDEKTGDVLDPKLAREARLEEIDYMKNKIDLYDEVLIEEAIEQTGKMPISTKWVDVNKGTSEKPDVRCRLVARDFKPKGDQHREDLFAAMPPLEAKKMLFRMAASHQGKVEGGRTKRMKLLFIDVKKAHLYGVVQEHERVYVELPAEAGTPGKCGRLKRWLYGMRPAAQAWERDYTKKLEETGFKRGRSAPTVFFNEKTQVRGVVHGDDFTFLGYDEELDMVTKHMQEWYLLKVRARVGPDAMDSKEVIILNRKLEWKHDGITFEADDKHAKILCKELGLDAGSRGLDAPIVKETKSDMDDEDMQELLGKEDATKFRALAARANYLAQDRMDIQYTTKEICRDMANPRKSSFGKLKRLARYLVEHPTMEMFYKEMNVEHANIIDVYSDSDWAGCLRTRRSTSGGVVTIAGGAIKTWSTTQSTVALSSGEAEYYALTKAAAEGLGVQSLAFDLGWNMKVRIWVDSTAAKAIASRTGLGRVRHLEVRYLWVQDALKDGKFMVVKVRGDLNPADVLTKPHSVNDMAEMLRVVNTKVTNRGVGLGT